MERARIISLFKKSLRIPLGLPAGAMNISWCCVKVICDENPSHTMADILSACYDNHLAEEEEEVNNIKLIVVLVGEARLTASNQRSHYACVCILPDF